MEREETFEQNRKKELFGWLVVSFLLLMLGGWLTSFGLGEWYSELNFPPFQPPGWAFTPAWVIILSLLAIATWKITEQVSKEHEQARTIALVLYGSQLVLNAGWSLLFFAVRRPDFALGEIIILDFVLLGMVIAYFRISKSAGVLLLPYLFWLLFATAINSWIVMNNPAFG
ncbi:MAG: TspO/MBR family protein [Planctomycetota bacterium]